MLDRSCKGGVAGPEIPKIQVCQYDFFFFLRICQHALRALKGDYSSPKSDISPQKCSLFPRKDHSTTSIQPNLGNACILGISGPATPPLQLLSSILRYV